MSDPMQAFADDVLRPMFPDDTDAFDRKVAALEAELLDAAGLDNIPELVPLVDGFLFRNSMARVIGPSGSMKSFVMLDFAGHIGGGHQWHGKRTRQGLVIYLVAEGGGGIRKRVRAWEQYYGRRMTGVLFLPRPVQASDAMEWAVLLELCRRRQPALVIFDTQARITVGVEENSAKEMGEIVQRLEDLREACGACVALVHHQGVAGERGRGSTAVKGALQTEIRVKKDGKGVQDTRVTVISDKQKDDEELPDLVFALAHVSLTGEAKEDGGPVTSVVLVLDDSAGAAGAPGKRSVRALKASVRVMDVLLGADRPLTPHGIGDVLAAQEGGPLQLRTIQNALKELADQDLAEVDGMSGFAQLWRPVRTGGAQRAA